MSQETCRLSGEPMVADSYAFVIAGISLRKAFRKLKLAFPKKKKARADTFVVISATPTRVTFGTTGAAVGMPALTKGSFNAEIPLIDFEDIATRPYDDGDAESRGVGRGARWYPKSETESGRKSE